MTRYTPRRVTAAPRWFVAALMAGAAAITALSTAPPTPSAPSAWSIAQ